MTNPSSLDQSSKNLRRRRDNPAIRHHPCHPENNWSARGLEDAHVNSITNEWFRTQAYFKNQKDERGVNWGDHNPITLMQPENGAAIPSNISIQVKMKSRNSVTHNFWATSIVEQRIPSIIPAELQHVNLRKKSDDSETGWSNETTLCERKYRKIVL